MRKPENPGKAFLRRYKALTGRVDALQRAIDRALERATDTSVALKEIKVLSSPSVPDPMASGVVIAVDACQILYEYKAKAEQALTNILDAIDSLEDERQKELLTMRYICGDSFVKIMAKMGYAEAQTYVIHGKALIGINRWMELHPDRTV